MADAYITQSVYKKTREAAKTLSFVDVQLNKITDNLDYSAIKLQDFKKKDQYSQSKKPNRKA